jgi:cold shock CspA family protein
MIPLQIICRDFPLTPSLRRTIRDGVGRLAGLYQRIVRAEVTISDPHRRRRKGHIYHVTILLEVPGPDLVVSRESEEDDSHESLQLALHDAFRAAERQLESQVRRMRGFVKNAGEKPRGRVARIYPDLDYGFLETPTGEEVYFHRNSVKGAAFDRLEEGTPVHFHAEPGDKGPQATFVRVIRRARRVGSEAA